MNNIHEALQPGTQLQGGKYIIKEALGQGATGITYLAAMRQVVQGELGSFDSFVDVAIKEFYMKSECQRGQTTSNVVVPNTNNQMQVDQYRKSFNKEARKIAGLAHTNIVHVLGLFDENDTSYYVMQFIGGGSVKEYIEKNGAIPEDEALKYTRQIASALDYMHIQKKMCHYDLKPGNIMLTDNHDAMLIDFGIAKNYDTQGNETSTTPPGLTKGFAPIEQYSSIQGFSPKSDVYSLGATLYAMLTGVTPPEPFGWISGKPFTACPENVSPRAWGIVQRAMQPLTTQRPTMDELIALIDEKPIGRRKVNPEDDITIPDGDEQFDPDGEKTLTFEELQRRQQQQDNPSEDTIVTKKKGDTVQKNPLHPDSQKVEPQPSKPIVTPKPKQKSNTALIVVLCALIALVVAGGVTYFLLSDKPSSTEIAEGDETDATEEDEEDGEEKPIYSSDGRIIMRFTGKVENGQPVGRGLLTYLDDPDRVSYEGSFLNGLREDSAAVLTYRNGDVYRGQFIADHFGTGSYFIKETGEYFRGTFKDDQPNNGVWYDKDDNVLMTVSNGVSQ